MKQRIRDHVVPLVLSGTTRCLSWLSLASAHRFGNVLGGICWRLKLRPTRMVEQNLARAFPDLDITKRSQLARATLREAAKFATESGAVSYWPEDRWQAQVKSVTGLEPLNKARACKEPILILAPHYGNWEFVNLLVGRHGKVLYQPPRSKALNKLIQRYRQRSGAEHVATDIKGIRQLYRVLREGGQVGILPDQVPGPDSGINVPFFGHPCRTMTLVHRLITQFHPLVVVAYARRRGDGDGFDLVIDLAPETIHSADVVESATAMNQAIEEIVRRDPTQYQWAYNRYKQPRDKRLD